MLVKTSMIVAAVGQYGPFKDTGNVIPYVDLLDPDGGGVFRATRGQEATGDPPPAATLCSVELEFYTRDNGIKLRYLSIAPTEIRKAA